MKNTTRFVALGLFLLSSAGVNAQSWSLSGNAGTNPAVNFIGTTDNKTLKLRTNNQVRMVVTGNGKFGFGNASPVSKIDILGLTTSVDPVLKATVKYTGTQDVSAITGISQVTDSTGIGVEGIGNLAGVSGSSNNYGVAGAGYTGVFGSSDLLTAVGEPTGVWGQSSGGETGNGVFGIATGATQNISVWGIATDTAGAIDFAGYFQGNLLAWKYYQPSDARIKRDIQPLQNSLSRVLNVKTASYFYNTEAYPKLYLPQERQIGFIADNLAEQFPDLVQDITVPGKTNKTTGEVISQSAELKVVNYMGMIPVLTEAIQEQQKAIVSKDVQIENLQSKLSQLETRFAALEANTISSERTTLPATTARLEQNQPNPFSQSTQISYFIPETSNSASIVFTNEKGQNLRTVSIKAKGAGQLQVEASEFASGTVTYTLMINGSAVQSKTLVVAK